MKLFICELFHLMNFLFIIYMSSLPSYSIEYLFLFAAHQPYVSFMANAFSNHNKSVWRQLSCCSALLQENSPYLIFYHPISAMLTPGIERT